jgi:hypothetical protein
MALVRVLSIVYHNHFDRYPAADVVDEADDGEAEDDEPQAKKHNTGAVDLEKVTDFFEEKELIMSVGQSLNEVRLLSVAPLCAWCH